MKKIKLLFVSFLCVFAINVIALTPFYYRTLNSDGTPQTNIVTMQAWPPSQNGFTIYGTNIIYGANIVTNVPNSSGFFSNSIYPNNYLVSIPAINASFYAHVVDTTNYNSLAVYATNAPIVAGPVGGFAFITNYLGYVPTPSNSAAIIAALNFQPMTNSFASATNALGFWPATNTFAGIGAALGYSPAAATFSGIISALNYTPATNTFAAATNLLAGYFAPTNLLGIATTNQTILDATTNPATLYITNGILMRVSHP